MRTLRLVGSTVVAVGVFCAALNTGIFVVAGSAGRFAAAALVLAVVSAVLSGLGVFIASAPKGNS